MDDFCLNLPDVSFGSQLVGDGDLGLGRLSVVCPSVTFDKALCAIMSVGEWMGHTGEYC